MKIFYKGGRSRFAVSYNRKSYHFTPENNHILDIQEKEVINYIFSLPNRAEFEVVMAEAKPPIPEPRTDDKNIVVKKAGRPKKSKGGK